MGVSTKITVLRGSMCMNDEDDMNGPKLLYVKPGNEHIETDGEGKIQKEIILADLLQIRLIS